MSETPGIMVCGHGPGNQNAAKEFQSLRKLSPELPEQYGYLEFYEQKGFVRMPQSNHSCDVCHYPVYHYHHQSILQADHPCASVSMMKN